VHGDERADERERPEPPAAEVDEPEDEWQEDERDEDA
jgi:hypothetical protein